MSKYLCERYERDLKPTGQRLFYRNAILSIYYITSQSNSKRGVEISGSYYVTFIGIPDLNVVSSRSLVRINSYVSYNIPLTNGQVELEKIWTF